MINILFCGNDKVFDGMITTTLSILKRTKTLEPFTFYIFTMNVAHLNPKYEELHDDEAAFLNQIVKEYNPSNKVVKIDVKDIYMNEFSGCPNEGCYCSPYTLLRLLQISFKKYLIKFFTWMLMLCLIEILSFYMILILKNMNMPLREIIMVNI